MGKSFAFLRRSSRACIYSCHYGSSLAATSQVLGGQKAGMSHQAEVEIDGFLNVLSPRKDVWGVLSFPGGGVVCNECHYATGGFNTLEILTTTVNVEASLAGICLTHCLRWFCLPGAGHLVLCPWTWQWNARCMSSSNLFSNLLQVIQIIRIGLKIKVI